MLRKKLKKLYIDKSKGTKLKTALSPKLKNLVN